MRQRRGPGTKPGGRLQYLNNSRTFALSAYRRARELDEGALEASPEDLEIYRELEGS